MKRTATAAVAGLIAAATALLSWAPAAAAGDPQRGGTAPAAIVFTRGRPSSTELYTMGMHGGNKRRLTQDTAEDSDPEWSPDGTRIAWSRTTETLVSDIWVMNADGTDRRNLTHADGSFDPTWSPDGTQIAYERNFTIWVIDADGTDDHQISPAGAFDHDPAWSPDGHHIAFVTYDAGIDDIWVMGVDGSHRQKIVSTRGISERDPAWSPDGSKIAFSGNHGDSVRHVDVMRSDGTGLHIVVDLYSHTAAWSPDGSRLAFFACTDDLGCGLYRSGLAGESVRPFRRGTGGFSPDYRQAIPTS